MTLTTLDHPSFIDLRAFAAQERSVDLSDPFGAARRLLPLRTGPVEAGAIDLDRGSGQAAPTAGDCWMILAQGTVTIRTEGDVHDFQAGDSWVVAAGTGFEWRTDAPATILFLRHVEGSGSPVGIVPIDPDPELTPSGAPLAELLVGETPSCRNFTAFRSTDGTFTCGVWDSTPYHRLPMRYAHFELMYLLKGSVTFVDESGRERTFSAGDIFMVEQGASCSWESRETVAKVYAIYRPLA